MVRVPVRVRLRLFFCVPHPHKAPLGRAIGSGADCIARTRVTISRKDPFPYLHKRPVSWRLS
jgi:hypothetical protein